ncbi:metacaspase-2-like isoform X2 [Maniola jurtina]|uniref:metacaspase-2-like isoform X2 n=1 Tax=Maniola jurtina TaxID=191418 RepID=UPI001E68B5EC|nr:metacaspase-2-like isoform X2 [Maniola jurtina]
MAMKKIPIEEQSLLCASIHINNFKRVIEELVYNSLDALSSSIAIRVCIQENFIQVLDNGNGILKDNFRLLGQKYATSKYVDITSLKSAPDKYGYRGLSLASIIDVSQCVKITSRHENSNNTWMKTFFNGKEKEICRTASRPSKGSTVEIKGFLYNLNIQRKSIDTQNELQNIKIALQQLSLVHCNVSISLRDDSKNNIILQIHKNSTLHDTIRSVFQISEKDFQELKVEKNEYKVKAFIGKNTAESNNYHQWIYINGKFIQKSILHRKINESLSKFLNSRNCKTKNMHNEDGNDYFNSNIPFYFIFITCPFYDYEMNYNSEKSIVEFKDWKEVNNLIEKLIQFYSGGLVTKKQELNKIGNAELKSDTRAEIKGIMEKILNNKNKPPKISQLQNGVKGKILKRGKKKKKDLSIQKILNKKTETNNPCHLRDYPKCSTVKTSDDKLKQQPINLNGTRNLQMQNLTNKGLKRKVPKIKKIKKQVVQTSKQNLNQDSSINNPRNNDGDEINPQISEKKKFQKLIKTNKKFKKSVKTVKHIDFNDSLAKRFESPTKIVRKRIKYLKQRVLKALHTHIFKEYSCPKNDVYSFINNETQYQTITKNTAPLSLCKNTTDKNLKITTSNVYISGNKNEVNNLNYQIVKKSYDLIKTVITSQYNVQEYKNTQALCRHPYERQTNNTYNETDIPMGTYNSHNNNAEAAKRMGYFISEASRNNFILHNQDLFPISNKNNYNKPAKLPRDKHKSRAKISNYNFLNRYYNQEPQSYAYTIEMTDSHEIINCRSETFHSMNNNLPQVDNHTQSINRSKSIDLVNTYYNHEGHNMRALYHTDNYAVNKTYSLEICNTPSPYYYLKEVRSSKINETVDNENKNYQIEEENLIILESESSNTEIHHDIELHRHSNELRDLEKEFENTFVNGRDTVTHSDHSLVENGNPSINNANNNNALITQQANDFVSDQNINSHIQRLNIFTNCKELSEHKIDKLIRNIGLNSNLGQETRSLQIDREENHGDKIYSFQIKSRHRFLRKAGHLCKLQNAYSCNDDNAYYKDMIYTNFANDVLLNTEIYEPEIQNAKNLFSNHIEKVNTDIQKQNADLKFDSSSLTRAKVLGQVDRKFIAVVLNGRSVQTAKPSEFLVLFDQHAVDERIRLENNLADYIQGSDWKSIDIDPILMVLSTDDYLYLVNHKDKLAQFGLQWTFTSENKILFNALPKAILGKNPRQVEIVMKAVKKLISEQIKAIKSLRGNVSVYPKSIMELVFSEACRYAIKFGDKLSKSECLNMINSLARCKTPFQCAHGRPVMAVLMELKNYSQTYKVNMSKVKKFKKMT